MVLAQCGTNVMLEVDTPRHTSVISESCSEINTACYDADEWTQAALSATGKIFEHALHTFTQVTHLVEAADMFGVKSCIVFVVGMNLRVVVYVGGQSLVWYIACHNHTVVAHALLRACEHSAIPANDHIKEKRLLRQSAGQTG